MQHPPANRVERTLLSAAFDVAFDFDCLQTRRRSKSTPRSRAADRSVRPTQTMNEAETRPEHIDPALKAAGCSLHLFFQRSGHLRHRHGTGKEGKSTGEVLARFEIPLPPLLESRRAGSIERVAAAPGLYRPTI